MKKKKNMPYCFEMRGVNSYYHLKRKFLTSNIRTNITYGIKEHMLPVDFSSSFPGDEISVSVFMRRRIPAGL